MPDIFDHRSFDYISKVLQIVSSPEEPIPYPKSDDNLSDPSVLADSLERIHTVAARGLERFETQRRAEGDHMIEVVVALVPYLLVSARHWRRVAAGSPAPSV